MHQTVLEAHKDMAQGKYGELTIKYEAGKVTRIIKTENIAVKG